MATSFEVFMRTHQDLVFSTAIRLLGRQSDAEDISQNVFLKAYENYSELEDNPKAAAWLRTVTKNLSLNQLTRYRNRWRFFSEMNNEESETDFVDLLPAPVEESTLEKDERLQQLEKAMQKLPESQRVPLVLYHFEEMSYEGIAEVLQISLSKVKTDIHRARGALKKKMLTV
jgi:RNA polymerase sigma-70 factor, ECF subfamily